MILDPQDDDLRAVKWHLNEGYLRGRVNGKREYAHRIVAKRIGLVGLVDHINGDRSDNRRENLRAATRAQNNRNQVGHRDRVHSKFKGVVRGRRGVGWAAQISNDCKTVGLGTYETEEEAARAYDMAAKFLFGEFARCNFEGTESKSPSSLVKLARAKRSRYGIEGVGLNKKTGRYRVYKTGVGRAYQHVGTFLNLEDAICAAEAQQR